MKKIIIIYSIDDLIMAILRLAAQKKMELPFITKSTITRLPA